MSEAYTYIPANSKIPALYANEDKSDEETLVVIKLFNPVGSATWYLTEYSPEEKVAFGYVTGMTADEWGYVSITELESLKLRLGQKIERDLHFSPISVAALKEKLNARVHV